MTKYVFVTGGVVSGLGKGITAASIALLLKSRGFNVFMQKFDPYINVDPGTMSPYQHGEVFVTSDGSETDLDLGHYERFIDTDLNYSSSVSMGRIYSRVIEKERRGDYLGGTVQIVPHVTNEIKKSIFESSSTSADFVITEIGGTVGDIEGAAILEALRQIKYEKKDETFFVHTTLIPYIFGSDELKTKPTQQSVIELRRLGIQVDALVCRTPMSLDDEIREKLSLFSSIPVTNIIEAVDVKNIYEIPLNFYDQGIDSTILKHFNMEERTIDLAEWKSLVARVNSLDSITSVAIVGKYVSLHDAYLSVSEALKHAGYFYNTKIDIKWIDSEGLEDADLSDVFLDVDGILVPGGFGSRGIPGKIAAIKHAREKNIPFLGICLGMQLATIEFARNVCSINADSKEFNELSEHPIIDIMEEQKSIVNMGGTMRLGNFDCLISKDTLAFKLYKSNHILERHRHRYEFNNKYRSDLEKQGFVISGINEKANLVEIIELRNHPYFIACQFHPEFKSRPIKPHPLFLGLIEASKK